jgi:hypothetical protein
MTKKGFSHPATDDLVSGLFCVWTTYRCRPD